MSTMVRTQIYIPRDMYEKLRARSEETGLSMAQQVREALREYLGGDEDEGVILHEDDPIWQIVGAVSMGPSDVSVHHDRYLYGWEKDK